VAKKRSLFDDKPAEIQELTYIIKQDINSLNKEIIILQQVVKTYQSQSTKNVQKHSNNVVITLQSKLATMSKSFENVLKVRSENLKKQSDRKEQFVKSGSLAAMSLKGPKLAGQMGKSVLLEENDNAYSTETVINMDTDAKNQYKQQLLLMDEQDNFVRDRANAMESIEQTIVDLGTIYQQLATLIKEQDEVIQRIDHNVDETEMNVSAAHGELLKYFQSVTSNRWLIIKIFLVLVAFFVIFVIFAA
jgi:syntaxin 5